MNSASPFSSLSSRGRGIASILRELSICTTPRRERLLQTLANTLGAEIIADDHVIFPREARH